MTFNSKKINKQMEKNEGDGWKLFQLNRPEKYQLSLFKYCSTSVQYLSNKATKKKTAEPGTSGRDRDWSFQLYALLG